MIFEDKSGIRWFSFLLLQFVGACLILTFLAVFVAGLFVEPRLPAPEELPQAEALGATELKIEAASLLQAGTVQGAPPPKKSLFQRGKPTRAAFILQDFQTSIGDLRRHVDDLDAVLPNWYQWTDASSGLRREVNAELAGFLKSSSLMVVPLVSNADANGVWHGKAVGRLMANRRASDKLIEALCKEFTAAHASGINVDFESLAPEDRKPYAAWLGRLAAAFHRHDILVTVDVPLSDPAFDYAAIGAVVDGVIVMAYDEHFNTSEPGPVASADWVRQGMEKLVKLIPPERILIGLGAYGYDWDTTAETPARSISFAEAMHLADSMDAGVDLDTVSQNEHFEFKEPDGDDHEIWLLDGVTCWNQFWSLRNAGLGGFALWRLGTEEEGIWEFLRAGNAGAFNPNRLSTVSCPDSVMVVGAGEVYRLTELPVNGKRSLTLKEKAVTYATYTALPKFATVEKQGHSDERQIALTFDDGPDPRWTPQILDVLRENAVPATFFLVGSRVESCPELVRKEFAQGHTLGNHSYSHPHLCKISRARIHFELNMTHRAVEAVTGRQTTLFRAPFDTDTTPLTPEQFRPLYQISRHGYYIVGAEIDSLDYTLPGAHRMVENVLNGIQTTGGNIVVFHDFGRDRAGTVAAVRTLIPLLKKQGYRFVTVDQLLGFPRDFIMPMVPASEAPFLVQNKVLTWMVSRVWPLLSDLLWLVSGLAIFRIAFLGALIAHASFKQRSADRRRSYFTPPVAVLIPAFNEAPVIKRTIAGVLRSDYPDLAVVVVDDGSVDCTVAIVAAMAERDPRVRLIRKKNGGKSSALNLGFKSIEQQYVVTIDADTIVHPDTISHLIEPFVDETVDAVCGNVQVGNVHSLLTRFQDVEYVTTQNYDRRAFEALNCITVVPGATGAWKRESVLKVGGYSEDTLTEDADLTIHMIANGGRIVYAPQGKSVTEAPENLRALYKQRFRWSFGMLQSLWKHRRHFGRGTLGCIAMPNITAQILLLQLAPLCDVLLLFYLLTGEFTGVAKACVVLFVLEMISSLVAFKLDHRRLDGLWVVFIQRFVYRPILYSVAIAAVLAIFRGKRHGWNKLHRTGSVSGMHEPEAESEPEQEPALLRGK